MTPLMTSTLTNHFRVGFAQERVISPQCLVICGASGDLPPQACCLRCSSCFRQRLVAQRLSSSAVLDAPGVTTTFSGGRWPRRWAETIR